MLVITRKMDESVIIDGHIEVVVIGISKDGVRLGINAPKDIQVHRREVFEAIAQANRAAATKEPQEHIQDAAALIRANSPKVKITRNR